VTGFTSFEDDVAAGAYSVDAGGALPVELPEDLQQYGITTPNPSEFVSDHSAEGANYQPTARDIPQDPPQPPLWSADHDVPGFYPAYDANENQEGNNSLPHAGTDRKKGYGLLNIGRPFQAAYAGTRHLRTDQWDVTGKQVLPADAPSAYVQIWNSEHWTVPRFTGFDEAPLFENTGTPPSFSVKPGYLGVSDSMPDTSPRQWGSQVAQLPDDPQVTYVQGANGMVAVDYGWDF
jgi:hypothetical protein